MKQFFALLIMLSVAIPGYGEIWDDLYQSELDLIEKSIEHSVQDGYNVADGYAWACYDYIDGFIDGNTANGNYQEFKSKRYVGWRKSFKEMFENQKHFVRTNDYANASYYAKKRFELNCQYKITLKRETFQ